MLATGLGLFRAIEALAFNGCISPGKHRVGCASNGTNSQLGFPATVVMLLDWFDRYIGFGVNHDVNEKRHFKYENMCIYKTRLGKCIMCYCCITLS